MNDMFEEAFAGFRDFGNENADNENENEPKTAEVNNAAAAAAQ